MADNWNPFLSGLSYLESNRNPNAGNRISSARGAFQFLNGTAREAVGMGIPNPQVGTYDDQANATKQYIQRLNPKAAAAIEAGDYGTAGKLLKGTWPSLPGGSQPQNPSRYAQFNSILGGGAAPEPQDQQIAGGEGQDTAIGSDRLLPQQQKPQGSDWSSALMGAGAALAGISNPAQGATLAKMANEAQDRNLRAAELDKPQVMNIGGNIYAVNPQKGEFKQIGTGPQEQTTMSDMMGNQYQAPKYLQPGQTPPAPPFKMDPNVHGEPALDAIKQNEPGLAAQVEGIGNFKQAPLTRGSKFSNSVMNMVQQVYPGYNAGYWKDIQDANKDVGPQGVTGRKMVAMNNMGQHTGAMVDLISTLDPNSNVVPWNKIEQAFGKEYAGHTGVTNTETLAAIIGTETAKALHGVGPVGEKDEAQWQSYLKASQTKPQLLQRLDELATAIRVQENSSYHAYEVGTHGVVKYSDQHPKPLISPEASAAFDKVHALAEATRQPSAEQGASNKDKLLKIFGAPKQYSPNGT